MKAYVVRHDIDVSKFLPELEITDNLEEADFVIFGDGPTVSPSLYGEKKRNDKYKCNINRDRSDKSIYTKLKANQVAIGIGRGSNFLAVMNGAKLVQESVQRCKNFSYPIILKVNDAQFKFEVIPSVESQIINLMDCENFEFLAKSEVYSLENYSKNYTSFLRRNGVPEIVKFTKENGPTCICIQFHPELLPDSILSHIIKSVIYAHPY